MTSKVQTTTHWPWLSVNSQGLAIHTHTHTHLRGRAHTHTHTHLQKHRQDPEMSRNTCDPARSSQGYLPFLETHFPVDENRKTNDWNHTGQTQCNTPGSSNRGDHSVKTGNENKSDTGSWISLECTQGLVTSGSDVLVRKLHILYTASLVSIIAVIY